MRLRKNSFSPFFFYGRFPLIFFLFSSRPCLGLPSDPASSLEWLKIWPPLSLSPLIFVAPALFFLVVNSGNQGVGYITTLQ